MTGNEPKFKDYSLRTRKFLRRTVKEYLTNLEIPNYICKKKLRKGLMMEIINFISEMDLGDDEYYLYLCDNPFCDIVTPSDAGYNDTPHFTSFDIPPRVVRDINNTISFYESVLKK